MRASRKPLRVLVVEDEALLAMDLEAVVEDEGHQVVAEAASLREVEALPISDVPDLAFVDLQLAEGSSGLDVAVLVRNRWPKAIVIYVTANARMIPDDWGGGHGVIAKPFSRNGLLTAMRYIAEGMTAPPPVSPVPASFVASPAFAATWQGSAG